MHHRRIELGETTYAYYSHSRREEVVAYRRLAEQWLAHYPEQHLTGLLKRLKGKNDGAHESAFFELFLHEYVLRLCDDVEIEGLLADSGKRADFVLHYHDGDALAVEALPLQPIDGVISENVMLVNDYVIEVTSSDFYIWFGESKGTLDRPPRKRHVQRWAERVLSQLSWEEAHALAQRSGSPLMVIEPLKLHDCLIEAKLYVRSPEARTEQTCLGVLAGSHTGSYEVPAIVRNRVLKKIRNKKSSRSDVPFVLAVNIRDRVFKPGEEELEVLHGFKHKVRITPRRRDDGTVAHDAEGLFSPDGTEGVWSTIRNESQYGRCSAIWFFHQVGIVHPHGTRQAMYLNPNTDHHFRMHALQHFSTAGLGLPD